MQVFQTMQKPNRTNIGNKDGNPWPYPATNDTASLCGMRETKKEGLWFVGSERGAPSSLSLGPFTASTAAREWRCLRSSICILPRARRAHSPSLAGLPAMNARSLHTLYFPAQSCWAALYSDPFKVHFACNYGAELLKQKCGEGERREVSRRSLPNGAPPAFAPLFGRN